MSYLADLAKKRADKRQQSAKQHDEYLASLANDETSADELRGFIKFFVLPIFFVWVTYVGHLYLSKELSGVVPDEHVFWLAWGLPLVFQVLKVYGATKCLRAWHFKWYDNSAADLWIYLILGLLTALAFAWTLKISVWDVNATATERFIEKNSITLDAHLKNATADIDARIAEQKQKEQATGSVRTKKGGINWAVQPIAAENAKSSSSLDEQRAAIVTAATTEFEKNAQSIEQKAQNRGDFFQRFGGFGEFGEGLCLILIGLLEAKLRRMNAKKEESQQAEAGSAGHSPNGHTLPHYNGQPAQNGSVQRYYFNRQTPTGNVEPANMPETEQKTVAQSPQTVAQQNTVAGMASADHVLELLRQTIQKDVANFNNRQASPKTVSGRICEALDNAFPYLLQPGFTPSRAVGARLYGYLVETVFPALNVKGWPYDRDTAFASRLLAIIPKEHAAT